MDTLLFVNNIYIYYTEYLGRFFPTINSHAWLIPGKSSILLSPGICLATVNAIGKKLPNKLKKPNISTLIPIIPHLIYVTNIIPKKKHIVPLILSGFLNRLNVLVKPIAQHKPAKNNILPD